MLDTIGRTAFETLTNVVSKISLPFASLLSSPFASFGIDLLAHAFGIDASKLDDLAKKISEDTQASIKINTLLLHHQTAIEKINAENYKTEVDDRKSAREREIALKDWVPTILAVGFLINYACIQFYCVSHPSSEVDVISARFQDVLIMIMSYFFGSAYRQVAKKD